MTIRAAVAVRARRRQYYDDRYARPQNVRVVIRIRKSGSDPAKLSTGRAATRPSRSYPRPRHGPGRLSRQVAPTGQLPERGYPDQRGYQDQGPGCPDQGRAILATSAPSCFSRLPGYIPATTRAIAKRRLTPFTRWQPTRLQQVREYGRGPAHARRRAAMCPLAAGPPEQ